MLFFNLLAFSVEFHLTLLISPSAYFGEGYSDFGLCDERPAFSSCLCLAHVVGCPLAAVR